MFGSLPTIYLGVLLPYVIYVLDRGRWRHPPIHEAIPRIRTLRTIIRSRFWLEEHHHLTGPLFFYSKHTFYTNGFYLRSWIFISNYKHYAITHSCLNPAKRFSSSTLDVKTCMSNCVPYKTMTGTIYRYTNSNEFILDKRPPGNLPAIMF